MDVVLHAQAAVAEGGGREAASVQAAARAAAPAATPEGTGGRAAHTSAAAVF